MKNKYFSSPFHGINIYILYTVVFFLLFSCISDTELIILLNHNRVEWITYAEPFYLFLLFYLLMYYHIIFCFYNYVANYFFALHLEMVP